VDRVFLDANVLFSAAYRPDAGLRRLWTLPDTHLLTSAYAITEARRNLTTAKQRAALHELLVSVQVVAPSSQPLSPSVAAELPEKDRPILAAAIGARATHLLTGDVQDFGMYYGQTIEGVLILRPAVYFRSRRS
jgi:predicted nucleic acid-binding protein